MISGGDNRGCLYGRQWFTAEKRKQARGRDRQYDAGFPERS